MNKPVCVRTQVPPATPPGLDIVDNVFANGYLLFFVGQLGDKTYYLASNGTAFERTADGTATALAGTTGGLRDASGIVDGDSLLIWIDGGADVFLGRIANGTLTTRKWTFDVGGIFRSQDGVAWALDGSQLVPVPPDLTHPTDTSKFIQPPAGALFPLQIWPLRDYGFVGYCRTDTQTTTVGCASADGRTVANLGELNLRGSQIRQSFRPDRIWLPVPGGWDTPSELGLWNGSKWVMEAIMPSYETVAGEVASTPTIQGVIPLSRDDDRVLVFIGDNFSTQAAYAEAGCFVPLYQLGTFYYPPFEDSTAESLLQTAPDTVTWSSTGRDLVTLRTSSFPRP
jgi:hypothetical protein